MPQARRARLGLGVEPILGWLVQDKIRSAEQLIGASPDRLTLSEAAHYRGSWIALEIYTPETLPLRIIEAMGRSSADCILQLNGRGLNPARFEFVQLGA